MNDDDFNKRFNGMVFNTSWTQPYNISMNPVYQQPTVQEEMQRIETIDSWVEAMSYYPDAENLIKGIMQEK